DQHQQLQLQTDSHSLPIFAAQKTEMMKLKFVLWMLLVLVAVHSTAQSPFQISLEPLEIKEMPGLQSFAWGQADGKWLLMGGRVDGLHRRQPFASMDSAGHHYKLVVADPTSQKTWSAPLTSLPNAMQEQLASTNLEFHQHGKFLYIFGGYGYSPSSGDHKTYPYMTAVDVGAAIQAILNGESDLKPYFRQLEDPKFAVTGGQLERIGEDYFLVGGQDFGGRYNPMSPDHGPGFVQKYNHTALRFQIIDDGKNLQIKHLPSESDTVLLHRRDYNMLPQIFPDGKEGLTAFSGVFQYGVNIPWLHCLDIHADGMRQSPGFFQYYNHYHCARIPIFDAQSKEMHNLFFGGIAAYYDSLGVLTHNRDVPFVKTIARVTRTADGKMAEFKLPVEMPDYLGASSEFIPAPDLPKYENGVLKLDEMTGKSVLLGYIVGGIDSQDDNIFWVNEGEHSKATSQVWKVYLRRNANATQDVLNTHSISPMQLQVLPNPFKGEIEIDFNMVAFGHASIQLYKGEKKLLLSSQLMNNPVGPMHWKSECKQLKKGGIFTVVVTANGETARIRLVVEL
ncbi:MAG: hypothetical protein KA293_05310, partial [Bacteroidia bacterium]|nr:hypothetical protein [Bacteroidia bacterium]